MSSDEKNLISKVSKPFYHLPVDGQLQIICDSGILVACNCFDQKTFNFVYHLLR